MPSSTYTQHIHAVQPRQHSLASTPSKYATAADVCQSSKTFASFMLDIYLFASVRRKFYFCRFASFSFFFIFLLNFYVEAVLSPQSTQFSFVNFCFLFATKINVYTASLSTSVIASFFIFIFFSCSARTNVSFKIVFLLS